MFFPPHRASATLGILLLLGACSRGPDVEGLYRVEDYRENTLTCDEVGHVGGGPSHVRLVAELQGRAIRLDRCPTGASSCASEGLDAIRFVRGDASGWAGDHDSARRVGPQCALRRRAQAMERDVDGRLHVELRTWADERGVASASDLDDACSTERIVRDPEALACTRYEAFDLVPVVEP